MTRSEDTLRSLALNDERTVHTLVAAGDPATDAHRDPRTTALVRLSALVSIDAPVAAYQAAIGLAHAGGVTTDEMIDVLRMIAPIVGGPRIVAAASALSAAIGYEMAAALEAYDAAPTHHEARSDVPPPRCGEVGPAAGERRGIEDADEDVR